jgi:hypothetical protein
MQKFLGRRDVLYVITRRDKGEIQIVRDEYALGSIDAACH